MKKFIKNKFRRKIRYSDYYDIYNGFTCIVIYQLKDYSLKYRIYKSFPGVLFNKWNILSIYVKYDNKWRGYLESKKHRQNY